MFVCCAILSCGWEEKGVIKFSVVAVVSALLYLTGLVDYREIIWVQVHYIRNKRNCALKLKKQFYVKIQT